LRKLKILCISIYPPQQIFLTLDFYFRKIFHAKAPPRENRAAALDGYIGVTVPSRSASISLISMSSLRMERLRRRFIGSPYASQQSRSKRRRKVHGAGLSVFGFWCCWPENFSAGFGVLPPAPERVLLHAGDVSPQIPPSTMTDDR
jgi:hypothetical protein